MDCFDESDVSENISEEEEEDEEEDDDELSEKSSSDGISRVSVKRDVSS